MNKEAFFPQGNGTDLYWQITTFGNGQVGQAIKTRIESGIACEEILPDGIGRICPNLAAVGISWQVNDLGDTLYVCNGEGTVPLALVRLKSELGQNGFPNARILVNGHGEL